MHAIIMAGGKGTRLKELTAEIPKPMIPIDGIPILLHQINNLSENGIKDIILIVGHLGQKIVDYFGNGSKFGVKIDYYFETEPLGTGGALYYIKDKVEDDFVLLYGDVFMNVDFSRMVNFHKDNSSEATLFVHPNSHPYDSDIIIEKENRVTGWSYKNIERTQDYKNLVNSGIYVLSKKIFKFLDGKKCDLEKEVIINMIGDAHVFAYKSTEYAKDMGTPERLSSVNEDYKNRIPIHRNLKNKQKCIFLDRDGTINVEKDHINNSNQIELLPRAADAIKMINNSEYICVVVTNQPVIARGECSFENMDAIHNRLETLLGKAGAYVNDIMFCPHHPHSGYDGEVKELKIDCDCRKPKSGMFIKAKEKYNIDFSKSIIIGDSTQDIEAGNRLDMKTVLVKTGYGGCDNKHQVEPDMSADNLFDAITNILGKS